MSTAVSIWEKSGSIAGMFWEKGKADFPVYDVHGHMGSHSAIYMKRCTPDAMAKHLERAGVTRLIFAHHSTLWGDRRNAEDYKVCCEYPEAFRMYVAINPHYPERIKEDLAMYEKWQPYAMGLKILADYHQVKVTDPRYDYALKFAEERGLPILFHTWGSSVYNNGVQFLELIARYPNITFLLGHSLHGDWAKAIECAQAGKDNVYLELTGIPGEHGIIEMLCEKVGSEKLLFGTDMPWFDYHQVIGGVVSADISEEDMHNILHCNAEKLFGKKL